MSRQITKAVINRALPQALELLTSSTDEEVQACYPIIDVLNKAVRRGLDNNHQDKLMLINDLQIEDSPEEKTERADKSPKTLLEAMLAGAFLGSVEAVDQALRQGAELTACETSGRNILHYCSTGGNGELLRKLLKKLAKQKSKDPELFTSVLNARDANGWSPLAISVCRCHVSCVDAILEYKDDIDFEQTLEHSCPPSLGYERSKSNMLHLAAIQGHSAIITKLAECISIETVDSQQRNLFHYLASTRNPDQGIAALRTLLAQKDCSELLSAKDSHGRSALFCAAAYGNSDILLDIVRHMHQHKPDSFSLTSAMLRSTDAWTMSAIQVAFLKKFYNVIDKIGTVWAVYRHPDLDKSTFSQALIEVYEPVLDIGLAEPGRHMTPHMILRSILENQTVWANWLKNDLTASERACYELAMRMIQCGAQQKDEFAIIRAIRQAGVDIVYQTITQCLKAKPNLVINSREFLTELKAHLHRSLPPLEAQAIWKYVNAESLVAAKALSKQTSAIRLSSQSGRLNSARQISVKDKPSAPIPKAQPKRSASASRFVSLPSPSVRQDMRRVYASPLNDEWNDENLPSFAAPTRSTRRSPDIEAMPKYERQRLR